MSGGTRIEIALSFGRSPPRPSNCFCSSPAPVREAALEEGDLGVPDLAGFVDVLVGQARSAVVGKPSRPEGLPCPATSPRS